jgi:hypothetical protein
MLKLNSMKKLMFIALAIHMLFTSCKNNKTTEIKSEDTQQESARDLESKRIQEIKKYLIGTWTISGVKDEELTESEKSSEILFKENGVVKNTAREFDEKWYVKIENGKEFVVAGEQDLEIISIDAKKFVYLVNKDEVTLVKK